MESGSADRKTAAGILCCLISGTGGSSPSEEDEEKLSERIRKTCGFNKRMADHLAEIVLLLYSEENTEEWKEKEGEGLSAFMKEEFRLSWKGYAVWDAGTVTMDCVYEAEIILMPEESLSDNPALRKLLKENAFLMKDKIRAFFEEELRDYLDHEFDHYCTIDDYYEPVAEDFELDYHLGEWCGKNGFHLVSWEGEGYDEGFEPKFRGRPYY